MSSKIPMQFSKGHISAVINSDFVLVLGFLDIYATWLTVHKLMGHE